MSDQPANPMMTAQSSEDMFLAAQATSGDHVVDEDPAWPDCAYCGQPMRGYAAIDDRHYCHDDDDEVSCYMKASWSS